MEYIQGYKHSKFNCKEISIDEIKRCLDELKVDKITIDGCILFPDKKILMCDIDNPIMFVNNIFYYNSICVDNSYAKTHQKEIEELFVYICRNTKEERISIDDSILVTEDVINALLSNPNLKEVTLGNRDDVFVLTEDLYKRFKDSSINSVMTYGVDENLKENFDSLIGYNYKRNLINFDNYEKLQKSENMYLHNPLTDEEIGYLKYLNKNAKVNFSFDDYDNIFKCFNILRENEHSGLVIINVKEKNSFNNYLFSHLDMIKSFDNVKVSLDNGDYDLVTYMKYEKKLIDLILPAINLSPFEKYLYTYNVVKKFKTYKENKEDLTSSRDLYQILDNEYMVCVGYSHLLGDLLDKLGIENYDESVRVDLGLEGIPNDDRPLPDYIFDEKTGELKELQTEGGGHARRKVHLIDPKYEIDGYYFTDPTWDNDMEHDTYNFALMTEEEYIGIYRYNYYSIVSVNEFFFIHSLEEFYLKINMYLDKNNNSSEADIIRGLMNYFEKLDNEFYRMLINKYPDIEKNITNYTKEDIQNILLDIGERILQKSDHLVDGKTFRNGITALYRETKGLNGEELDIKVNEIMEYNKERHIKCFPTRYKIDKDDNKMVILNLYNKFDLDEQPRLGI